MKRVFIAATRQNDGKTSLSLGLISALRKRFKDVGFIKPVGQRYVEEDNVKIDEDSVLVKRVFKLDCNLKDTSPITIERGFTEGYIKAPDVSSLIGQIVRSFECVAEGKEIVVVEGTGHAGVGSVFDLSNAAVAEILQAKVIIIAPGGIGRPIDEVVLNKALFDAKGVEILGVIVNKVNPEKYDKVERVVRMGLERVGLRCLGVVPYVPLLVRPTVEQIMEMVQGRLLCGKDKINNYARNIIIGAMEPHHALKYFNDGAFMITAGDREDLILTAISLQLARCKECVSGLLLTGGILPDKEVLSLMSDGGIPVLLTDYDTYKAARVINESTIKVQPGDVRKIAKISELVEKYVDIDRIISAA